jgi:transcriptional regulator with XRE-family HTH domain
MKIDNEQNPLSVQQEIIYRLRAERISQGISQKEMADRSGLSLGGVCKLEEGKGVRLYSLLLYLKALGKMGDLDALLPPVLPRPEDLYVLGHQRQRASKKRKATATAWKWGDGK